MPQCTAKSKQTGEQCKQPAIPPSSKCHYHGGRSLRGLESPKLRDGKRSKYPERLGRLAAEAEADPEILNLTSLAAVYWARLWELFGQLDLAASSERTNRIVAAFRDYRKAERTAGQLTRADPNADVSDYIAIMREALEEAETQAKASQKDHMAWLDIDRTSRRLQSVVKQEGERREKMAALLPVERVAQFSRALVISLRTHFGDQPERVKLVERDVLIALGETPHSNVKQGPIGP